MRTIKVHIDPRTNVVFASSYIYGLWQLLGKENVKFKMYYFKDLIQKKGIDDFDQYFSFVVIKNKKVTKRIVVDFRDKNNYSLSALEWCNTYAKVNYNPKVQDYKNLNDKYKGKILSFGPNFTFNLWSKPKTIFYLITNYIKGLGRQPVSFRHFMTGYNFQLKRVKLEEYMTSNSKNDYIFFVANLYKEINSNNKKNNDLDEFLLYTNKNRAAFVRACKAMPVQFEGGMVASANHPNWETYKDVITNQYVKPQEYLQKIKQSAIVFNNPTVWGAHGWKLVEFLAMGKAIISLPLHNDVRVELEHGKHIHFIKNLEDIPNAVKKIVTEHDYRKNLEYNARLYYEKNLEPSKIIKHLLLQS